MMVHMSAIAVTMSWRINKMDKISFKDKFLKGLKWFFASFIWLFIILLALDIVTKNIVVNNITINSQEIVIIPYILSFKYIVNTKAAFGIGFNNDLTNRIVYIIIASVAFVGVLIYYIFTFKKHNKLIRAMIMMILVGAIGNLIDRIFYTPAYLHNELNGVVDWILFFPRTNIFPYTFNIADASIVVAVFVLIIYLIVQEVKENKKKKLQSQASDVSHILSLEEKERLERTNNEEVKPEEKVDNEQ